MASPIQFKVTKDEALILADALEHRIFTLSNEAGRNKLERTEIATALSELQRSLESFAVDKRLQNSSKDWTFKRRVRKYVQSRHSLGTV